jgi:hypothetical protein
MPIKDIQDNRPTLNRLGVIRLGVKKTAQNGKEYPAETEYFVLTDAPDVAAAYGEKPTELLIYLPLPTVDEVFPAHHELWGAAGNVCRGDGERILSLVEPGGVHPVIRAGAVIRPYREGNGKDYQIGEVVPCPGLEKGLYKRCADCRPRGTLLVMVRDPHSPQQLVAARLGYYQVSTNSYYNIKNLTGQLLYAADLAQGMGRPDLRGIPMMLKRVQRPVSVVITKDGEEKRQQVLKWFVDLEFDLRWAELANQAMAELAMGGAEALALPPGGVDPRTGEIVDYAESEYVDESGHWSDDEAAAGDFWAKALKLADSEDVVFAALEVTDLREWPETQWEALNRITAALKARE